MSSVPPIVVTQPVAIGARRDHNLDQPINRLPVEIIGHIFEVALTELRDTWPSEAYDDVRLVVTGVCSWWRAIAVANPTLWGTLIYQDDGDVTLWSHRWTLLCLSRSGDADLDVSISTDVNLSNEEGDDQFSRLLTFMSTVKPNWPRLTSLIIQSEGWTAWEAIFPLPEAAPRLRHLDIDIEGVRPMDDMARFRIFPTTIPNAMLVRNHPMIHTLKLSLDQISVDELLNIVRSLSTIRVLKIQNGSSRHTFDEADDRDVLRIGTPKLQQLTLINTPFSPITFQAKALRHLTVELPTTAIGTPPDPAPDFFPAQLDDDDDEPFRVSKPPAKLTLSDVRSSEDFFEPAVRLLRAYNGVSCLRLHGREALGKLLCAAFGFVPASATPLITAPGAKPYTGLTTPSSLRTLEIIGWASSEIHQTHVQVPDPEELTELAEVIFELLMNSPKLENVTWWSLHDPTSIAHPAFEGLRKACEKLMSEFEGRVMLKLA